MQQAQPPAPNELLSWPEREAQLKQITAWEAGGKIGFRTPEESQSASLKWLQDNSAYQIDIRGPWGQGGASISGDEQQVSVEIAGEGTFTGESAEAILEQQWGWSLPISDIYWWIRGLPAPNSAYDAKFIDERLLSQLIQQGWRIEYLRYNQQIPAMPTKVRLHYLDLKITIIIKTWIKL